MGRRVDLVGQKFSRLAVLEYAPRALRKGGNAHWKCRCDCGRETVVRGSDLRSGKTLSCGCLGAELTSKRLTRHGGSVARNCLVSNYRIGARERNLEFSLTHEECGALFLADCHYCSAPPSQTVRFGHKNQYSMLYNGIDRIDNNRGYVAENCVSCCKTCNSAKGTLTPAEFRAWAKRLVDTMLFTPQATSA
jgi:5-methylcytosine-specific restriction endonuclease McrA